MFKRHAPIIQLLQSLNHELLERIGVFFGGGTAIALRLNEFRISTDIDLFCRNDKALYAARHIAVEEGAGAFFSRNIPVTLSRVDRDGIKLFASVDTTDIKLEIFNLGFFPIYGEKIAFFSIPTLTPQELFTAKLFANANRYMDSRNKNKDIIDLGAMLHAWGEMPHAVWETAYSKYGQTDIDGAFKKAAARLFSRQELKVTAESLGINQAHMSSIIQALASECHRMDARQEMDNEDGNGPSM